MKCTECSREIGDNLKFCKYCGAPVNPLAVSTSDVDTIKCKSCGASIKTGVAFCTQCGTPINKNVYSTERKKNIHEKTEKKKRGKLGLILICVMTIISFLLVGGIAFYFMGSEGLFSLFNRDIQKNSDIVDTPDTENGNSATEEAIEKKTEKSTEAETEVNPNDLIVEDISSDCDAITKMIVAGTYNNVELGSGIIAYAENDEIVEISAGLHSGNEEYARNYYYVNGNLVFAEYTGTDIHKFFFDNGSLIRWSYIQDASDIKNVINYDNENTSIYLQYEKDVQDASEELIDLFQKSKQSSSVSTNQNTAQVVNMDHLQSIYASSELAESTVTHYAKRIADGDLNTAWVEAAGGQGIGESITLYFDDIYIMSGIVINAGYQKNNDLYNKNSRPKGITLEFSDGSSESFNLEDKNSTQVITFSQQVSSSSVRMIIDSVYAGNKYSDTCISEITIY